MADDRHLHTTCPFCRGQLTLDRDTGALLRSERAKDPSRDFESVLGDLKSADARREEDFRRAFRNEAQRADVLDKKFEIAQEKAAEDKDAKRINPMDMD